jgi:hypothetical protein
VSVIARSIACAHCNARRADGNASMNPSPWFFTTVPPESEVMDRTTSSCAWSTSSQR